MRAARNSRRWLRWLGVIAVLSNVLAGAVCHMSGQAQAAAGPIDDVLGPLAICTAHGEQAPAPNGNHDPGGKFAHCAACTLLAVFGLIVALVVAAVAFPSTFIFYQLRLGARTLADHLSLGGIRSRASPFPA
jgi:Protein of unknown function (DUF2946)